jgi:uncharacterized protein
MVNSVSVGRDLSEARALGGGPDRNRLMDHFPHRNLYTRIKASAKGVGLFAIRHIPQGTKLFVGDLCPTVRIPFSEVAGIADPVVRQMYIDFCPLVGEHFLAPQDFNQMTMSWYLNHSDTPNVVVTPDLQFTTSRFVASGTELTADYRTYSDHARKYIAAWQGAKPEIG